MVYTKESGGIAAPKAAHAGTTRVGSIEERDHVLQELFARERLLEERVGADVLGVRHVLRRAALADDEDGDELKPHLASHVFAQLEPRLPWQRKVETDKMGSDFFQEFDGTVVVEQNIVRIQVRMIHAARVQARHDPAYGPP